MGQFETSRRVVASPETILTPPVETPPVAIATETKAPITHPPGSVEADIAEAQAAVEALKKPKAPAFVVAFVKNVNPRELIRFQDGKTFRFPSALYRCTDPAEAEKIKEVSDHYGIVLQ